MRGFRRTLYVIKHGITWRDTPGDLPPGRVIYLQIQHWIRAGCFEAIVCDLPVLLRLADGRALDPSAGRPPASRLS